MTQHPTTVKAKQEVSIKGYNYTVIDQRPKLNEYYINMFAVDHARSVQTHTEKRHIINHKKDYRWRYCFKIIETNDPAIESQITG
jgi:hypothetical protein